MAQGCRSSCREEGYFTDEVRPTSDIVFGDLVLPWRILLITTTHAMCYHVGHSVYMALPYGGEKGSDHAEAIALRNVSQRSIKDCDAGLWRRYENELNIFGPLKIVPQTSSRYLDWSRLIFRPALDAGCRGVQDSG